MSSLVNPREVLKLLVVDDSKHDQATYRRYLSRFNDFNYAFTAAANGAQGLTEIRHDRPACVLLDYRLPDMTGLDFLKYVREDRALFTTAVVMLTGTADETMVVQALRMGAQDYLLKDSTSAENLHRAIHNAIEKVRLAREIELAIGTRDEFLSIASHELKTPLTSLTLQMQHGQLLCDRHTAETLPHAKIRRLFETSNAQIQKLARLVDDLLDVTRINAGKFDLNREYVDLAQLVREVLERFEEQVSSIGLEIGFESAGSIRGHWDRFRLEQVVVNLLSNAMKYGQGKPVKIEVKARADGRAELSVSDQGIGIPASQVSRVFERFERAKSDKGISGLGLGLYIARQIVEQHGGCIRVNSQEGYGSVFTVELPREDQVESVVGDGYEVPGPKTLGQ